MHRAWVLPLVIVFFGLVSVVGLRSIAPSLALMQLLFFGLGAIVFWVTARFSFTWWHQVTPWLYGGLLASLALTLVLGDVTRGSTRWISVGSINIQTSQLAIPIGALMLTWVISHSSDSLRGFLWRLVALALPAWLIFLQPDLGTTIVYLGSVGVILFLQTDNWLHLLGLAGGTVVITVVAWFFLLQPYQKERVFSFLGATDDQAQTVNYNAQQSLIAVGSGQVFGRGLGQGVQSHLRFLPERQTDFIFASLAEELGLAGSLMIVGMYTALIGIMIYIAEHAQDTSQQAFVYSIVVMTVFQTGVNIGMNVGLVPITGVTLPLISYGGSSVLSLCLCYGLVESIARRQKREVALSIE